MEDMRLALTEQEETQDQMEQVLEEKLNLIQELSGGKNMKNFYLDPRIRSVSQSCVSKATEPQCAE